MPGLHDACRLPFTASGLGLPWYAGYGNHYLLLGGIIPYSPALAALGTGASKPGPGPVGPGVTLLASADWEAATAALHAGELPASGGERRMLLLASSLAGGTPVSPDDTLKQACSCWQGVP